LKKSLYITLGILYFIVLLLTFIIYIAVPEAGKSLAIFELTLFTVSIVFLAIGIISKKRGYVRKSRYTKISTQTNSKAVQSKTQTNKSKYYVFDKKEREQLSAIINECLDDYFEKD